MSLEQMGLNTAPKTIMSGEIFESLPTVSCDDIEAPRRGTFCKTLIGTQWYMIDQEGARAPIEIRRYVVWED